MCSFQFHLLSTRRAQTSSAMADCFSLLKSRTAGRTRCDCFHTQEVITLDLPQLWLRLINIDEQLMRCQAGTRPFPSCLLMTPMERKNDLDLAMSPAPFISAKHKLLIIFSWWAGLWEVQLNYWHQRNGGQQVLVGKLFFMRVIIIQFHSFHRCFRDNRLGQTCSQQKLMLTGKLVNHNVLIYEYIYGPSCSKSLHTVIQTVIDPESRWIFPYRQSINYLVGIKTQHCAQIILQTVHSLKLPQRHGHEPCRQLLNCDEDTIPAGARNKVYVLSPLALSMHRGMSERHFLAAVRRQRDFRLAHGITPSLQ